MEKGKLLRTREEVQKMLSSCIDFWLNNAIDRENGGVYTCLDRKGEIFSTDKSVWMQGRCAWTFSYLCAVYGVKQEWLDAAKTCIDFLEEHCVNKNADGRLYFTVTADGRPLRQRRYYYSEAFYAMANAEYYGLTGKKEHLDRALKAYECYWDLWNGEADPTKLTPKTIPETRTGRSFGLPMIYLNVTSVLMRVDPERADLYMARSKKCVDDILKYHVHPELKCVLENVGPDGEARLEYSEGRVINPGHTIEGVWFLLEYAKKTNDMELLAKCEEVFDWAIESGWDDEYGGLFYFIDAKGCPPESYEHDMKLWWPHNETLIATLMLYRDTGKESYLDTFYKVYDYCMEHFNDAEYGEWFGYLRRDGKPTMPPCKGSTFKGPFHVPRMLVYVDKLIEEILADK